MITSAYKKRIFSTAFAVLMLILSLTGCKKENEPAPDYEKYKTDLVGIWCDLEGPEYVPESETKVAHYNLYEFTADGRLIYHEPTEDLSVYYDTKYELTDDLLTVEEAQCKIVVDEKKLDMINKTGTHHYRRMSMEEVCNFGVVYIDSDNYMLQVEYTRSFSRNFRGCPYEEIEDEETQAEIAAEAASTEAASAE